MPCKHVQRILDIVLENRKTFLEKLLPKVVPALRLNPDWFHAKSISLTLAKTKHCLVDVCLDQTRPTTLVACFSPDNMRHPFCLGQIVTLCYK